MRVVPLAVRPLTKEAFAPFGDVVTTDGAELRLINNGSTERFHDLAKIDVTDGGGRAIVSLFRGQPFAPPVDIAMVERHPLGSQMFFPLGDRPYLAVVAPDADGTPGAPLAFLCPPGIGVNYAKNTWHHPLLSLRAVSDFLVVDRDGPGNNLEEHFYAETQFRIDALT
ncbi:MAG: ureidoglycolate lyase [Oricola sp.]